MATKTRAKERVVGGDDDIRLPSAPNVAPPDLTSYVMCFYGEKSAGKSTTAAQFPGALLFQWEPGRQDIAARQIPDYSRGEKPLTWVRFKQYLQLVSEDETIKAVVIDTAELAWEGCEAYICEQGDEKGPWKDVGDGPYGSGWRALKREWAIVNNALIHVMQSRRGAVIYVSHARIRETTSLTGEKKEWIVPTCTDKCWDDLKSRCQIAMFFGFHGDQRLVRLRGTETLWAGVGPENKFMDKVTKEPIYALFTGHTPKEAFRILCDGFQNKLQEQDPDATIRAELAAASNDIPTIPTKKKK